MEFQAKVKAYLEKEKKIMDQLDLDEISIAINALYDAWNKGVNIYVMGNGGSAATASHMVCDFNKGIYMMTGKKFRFTCLNDNIPIVTAISNDISYDEIFSFQLKDTIKSDDVILAVSGSGNSKNIINAVEYAKSVGCKVIGMTGFNGGKLGMLADYHFHAPCDDMQIAEDLHMIFVHIMMRIFCELHN